MQTADIAALRRFSPEKMVKVNVFSTPRFFCDVYCLEPGQAQQPHAHEGSDKVYYVLDGVGRFRVGDEERTLGHGQIVLAPAGQPHGVFNDGPSRLVLLVYMAPNPTP